MFTSSVYDHAMSCEAIFVNLTRLFARSIDSQSRCRFITQGGLCAEKWKSCNISVQR